METSLRYGGDSKSLRIHAKEKLPLAANALCQLDGELDTKHGTPTCVNAMIRYFYPDLSASFGVGVRYNNNKRKLHYNIRGKKAFPVSSDGMLNFNIKGRYYFDEEFKELKYTGAAEFTWNIFNVKKDQDLRLKFGYDVLDKVPYLQIRENNWTFNADGNRRWNIRYDL
ncbi:Outer envelope pore protein 21B- chloroplastic [Striga hermonthica]|uniref:Outer envelope pore protein 21B- chloroplastic n=1 Tax=Striga hermonthica TaxID=68872 RepID=A0A9N7R2F3_STRHE|nr:Outer envelope pore protein 21B- chloroplastic [Striga hermonthica]